MTRTGRTARQGWGTAPVLAALLCWWGLYPEGASAGTPVCVNLDRAVVVVPAQLSGPERKALALLTDEVHKRTLGARETARVPEGVPV